MAGDAFSVACMTQSKGWPATLISVSRLAFVLSVSFDGLEWFAGRIARNSWKLRAAWNCPTQSRVGSMGSLLAMPLHRLFILLPSSLWRLVTTPSVQRTHLLSHYFLCKCLQRSWVCLYVCLCFPVRSPFFNPSRIFRHPVLSLPMEALWADPPGFWWLIPREAGEGIAEVPGLSC